MTIIKLRRGTSAQWAAPANGNPLEGELVYNTETAVAKIGNGTDDFDTLPSLGGAGGTDAEVVRDTIGTALQGAGLITVTPDDALNTITVSTTATANDTDANLLDRANHTGTQSADTLTDGVTNHVFTAADDTKLAGIAAGATANSSDATLLDRANHTGTQSSSTIADLTEAVQDILAATIGAGTGISVSYDDVANTYTITATGGGGSTDPEVVRDTIGTALIGTGLISVTVNDAADTITISTTATANDTDANLKARANHTGTQSADTIIDGTANKVYTAAEQTKLAGIATGATANDTDANLRDRATHTGTQDADTIIDGTLNHVFTAADDTKLAGIAAGATANDTDANLKNRANHTGSQTAATISDFSTAADARITAAVGVSVQAYDADLTTWGGKTAPTGTVVGSSDAQTLTNKILDDATTVFADDVDATKKLKFQVAGIATGITREVSWPDWSGDVVLNWGAQTLENKTITLLNNTVSGTLAQFNTAVTDADLASLAGAETLTNKTLALGSNTVSGTLAEFNTAVTDADLVSLAGTETLTNKRVTPRVNSAASNATPALDAAYDATVLTAQAAAITAFSLTGSFTAEQKHMIRIKDNGTARAITWTSTVIAAADGITLPTTTVVGKTHRIGCVYDEVVGKLIAVAVTSY